MKKIVLTIVCAFFPVLLLCAQDRDVLYLKNGSVLKGKITEYVIGESLKFQTADGSIFVYQEADIMKIEKEAVAPPAPKATTAIIEEPDNVIVPEVKPVRGWHFGFGSGSSMSVYNSKMSVPSEGSRYMDGLVTGEGVDFHLTAIADYRVTESFGIESGLRFHKRNIKFSEQEEWLKFSQQYLTVPLTAKYYLGNTTKSPFISAGVYGDFLIGASGRDNYGDAVSGESIKQLFNGTIPGVSLGAGFSFFRVEVDVPFSNIWEEDLFSSLFSMLGAEGATLTTNRFGLRISIAATF
jgi:hypothetical protein